MVGRFVEQQRLRVAEQRLRQQHADFLAALDLAHQPVVQLVWNVEALQQDGGVAFRLVAVLFADDALELAEAHAVGVGHLGLGVEDVALFERAPQPLVAHDHRVDDAQLVVGELILLEDAELLRADDVALLRRLLAGEQLHEGRLARAVRAGQAVAAAGQETGGYLVEENLRAEAHGDVFDANHNPLL